jgi:hypothetical protein
VKYKKQRTTRLQIVLSFEELADIDDFRFANRAPNRAAAIRELLRRGLGVASEDHGVFAAVDLRTRGGSRTKARLPPRKTK